MQTRSSPSTNKLHRLAQQARVAGYERMPKATLFRKLSDSYDIKRLERAELRSRIFNQGGSSSSSSTCSSSSAGGKRPRRQLDDDSLAEFDQISEIHKIIKKCEGRGKAAKKEPQVFIDPVMQLEVTEKCVQWKHERTNGQIATFNVATLVDYMLTTGDFSDPETRVPFSDAELADIDLAAKRGKLNKESVLIAKTTPNHFADMIFRRDALLGLERCAGEVVTDILRVIESYDPEEAQVHLFMQELPAFADYYGQLRDADPAFAQQCMIHWRLFLLGPPNKPNVDKYGLLRIVGHFLRACDPSLPGLQFSTSSTATTGFRLAHAIASTPASTPVNAAPAPAAAAAADDDDPFNGGGYIEVRVEYSPFGDESSGSDDDVNESEEDHDDDDAVSPGTLDALASILPAVEDAGIPRGLAEAV